MASLNGDELLELSRIETQSGKYCDSRLLVELLSHEAVKAESPVNCSERSTLFVRCVIRLKARSRLSKPSNSSPRAKVMCGKMAMCRRDGNVFAGRKHIEELRSAYEVG